ncbi:MAG: hypothetical protein ACRDJN_04245 [Chloroflexota bacterium]
MARTYAQYTGIVLIALGLVGLVLYTSLGEEPLFGLLNIELTVDVFRILTGALLAYVGYRVADTASVRFVAGGLGIVYLLIGLLGFVSTDLYELLSTELAVVDNVIHVVVGVLGVAVAWLVGRPVVAST